jgi:hypothetical protein
MSRDHAFPQTAATGRRLAEGPAADWSRPGWSARTGKTGSREAVVVVAAHRPNTDPTPAQLDPTLTQQPAPNPRTIFRKTHIAACMVRHHDVSLINAGEAGDHR